MGQLEVRNSREAASVKPHLTGLLLSQPPYSLFLFVYLASLRFLLFISLHSQALHSRVRPVVAA